MTTLADVDRCQPTMLDMLAPTFFANRERLPVLLDGEQPGAVAVVMLDPDPLCDELELAICVHSTLADGGRGLLVVAR